MNPLDVTRHVLNFIAPALFVALALVFVSRWLKPKGVQTLAWWWQAGVNALVGVAVLLLGLWSFGVDGKMATYAALSAACASSQWLMNRAWRS